LVKTAPSEYSPGTVSAVFHREPTFPPAHVVPYQVRLKSGSAVYVPADSDDFVRAPDAAEDVAEGVAKVAVS
jgi:hypothetical protein